MAIVPHPVHAGVVVPSANTAPESLLHAVSALKQGMEIVSGTVGLGRPNRSKTVVQKEIQQAINEVEA